MPQQYIGVYATKEAAPSIAEYPRPHATRRRLWFAWETPEGQYKVQALNAAMQPMSEAKSIAAKDFSDRYAYEADCLLAPEGYAHPMADRNAAAAVPLPDLFWQEKKGGSPASDGSAPAPGLKKCGVYANDPSLLLEWVKASPQTLRPAPDPAKMPFARLVSEIVDQPEDSTPDSEEETADHVMPPSEPVQEEEAQRIRQLRSRFVQALLLLRRGAKSGGLAALEELLAQPHEHFEGGAQLFSEFGLGLRRLGFAKLALAAHRRALLFAPGDERVLFNIARSCHDLELFSEAGEYLEQALAAAPDFAAARQLLAFLDLKSPRHGMKE